MVYGRYIRIIFLLFLFGFLLVFGFLKWILSFCCGMLIFLMLLFFVLSRLSWFDFILKFLGVVVVVVLGFVKVVFDNGSFCCFVLGCCVEFLLFKGCWWWWLLWVFFVGLFFWRVGVNIEFVVVIWCGDVFFFLGVDDVWFGDGIVDWERCYWGLWKLGSWCFILVCFWWNG